MMSIDDTKKPKRGRPPVDTVAVNLRLSADMLKEIDDFRRFELDVPSRPEAIRRILQGGMSIPLLADVLVGEVEQLNYAIKNDYPQLQSSSAALRKALDRFYERAQSKPVVAKGADPADLSAENDG